MVLDILFSALSLDQLSSAMQGQCVGPVVAAPTANYTNKERRVLRARGNLQKAGLQGLSQRRVLALAVETQSPL